MSSVPRFTDPRDLAVYFVQRVNAEDWAALQPQLAEEYQGFAYGTGRPFDYYQTTFRPGFDMGLHPDEWVMEEYSGWIVARLQGVIPISLVMQRLSDSSLRLDPGPCARQIAAYWRLRPVDPPNAEGISPVQMVLVGDGSHFNAIAKRVHRSLRCVSYESDEVLVTASVIFRDKTTGSMSLDALHWSSADGESGDVRLVWTDAVLTSESLVFPRTNVGYATTFALVDAPIDGTAVFHLDAITIHEASGPDLTFAMEATMSDRPYPDPDAPPNPTPVPTPTIDWTD